MVEMTAPTTAQQLGLRIVLIIAALLESFDALSSVSTLFDDMSEIPGPRLRRLPDQGAYRDLSGAGAGRAGVRRGRPGALRHNRAGGDRVHDLAELHALGRVARAGVQGVGAFETPARIIAFPLMAAIAVAARNQRLRLATALASIPIFHSLIGLIIFAARVGIYGF
jgi:hypothetical protein